MRSKGCSSISEVAATSLQSLRAAVRQHGPATEASYVTLLHCGGALQLEAIVALSATILWHMWRYLVVHRNVLLSVGTAVTAGALQLSERLAVRSAASSSRALLATIHSFGSRWTCGFLVRYTSSRGGATTHVVHCCEQSFVQVQKIVQGQQKTNCIPVHHHCHDTLRVGSSRSCAPRAAKTRV